MKSCKSCVKEIDDKAKKCPYCQAYQSWLKNPQNLSLLLVIPILGYSYWSIGSLKSKPFKDYENYFTLTEINQRAKDNDVEITYKVSNSGDIKWGRIKYQIVGYGDTGTVITTKNFDNYSWVIDAHSSAFLTVSIALDPLVKKWETKLVDLDSGRF